MCEEENQDKIIFTTNENDNNNCSDEINSDHEWIFTLDVNNNYNLAPNEYVGIIGNCSVLGEWKPENGIPMNYDNLSKLWQIKIELPSINNIQYRYFIFSYVRDCDYYKVKEAKSKTIGENIIIRCWETHIQPRSIHPMDNNNDTRKSNDIFGVNSEKELKIDRGWLTYGAIVEFMFFNGPFYWNKEHRIVYVKITPMSYEINRKERQVCFTKLRCNKFPVAFVEVVNIKFNNCALRPQSEYGIRCGPKDLVIFHITVSHPKDIAYVIDIYAHNSEKNTADVDTDPPSPEHLGSHYVLPNELKNDKFIEKLLLPIKCTCCNRKLGTMEIQYLIIRPIYTNNQKHKFTMEKSYQRYWKKYRNCLNIAHYGSGNSFKYKQCMIRQNTIASFQNAIDYGADIIHFPVVISKDNIPFVYHDFKLYATEIIKKNGYSMNELKSFPINELEFNKILNLKLFYLNENSKKYEQSKFGNEDIYQHKPFPKLSDVLELINNSVAFNIELIWPQRLTDGNMEFEIDREYSCDFYIDHILNVLLENADNRKIILSSSHPNVCTALRYKQNIWPVMFITQGKTSKTKKFESYLDPRCNSIETALCFAKSMEFLGLSCPSEIIAKTTTLFTIAKLMNQIMFIWGKENMDLKRIKLWRLVGVHGIVYDKINFINAKELKRSDELERGNEIQRSYEIIDQLYEYQEKNHKSQENQEHENENTMDEEQFRRTV